MTSHSSGEIGAGYAAGAICREFAMAMAYFRDLVTMKAQKKLRGLRGGMLAVGLSQKETEKYIQRVTSGNVIVACVNSPSSVTVSGDAALQPMIESDKAFARKFCVDAAYHSHHMQIVAEDYLDCLRDFEPEDDFGDVIFPFSVTEGLITSAKELDAGHWVQNILQPVLFNDSLNMCLESPLDNSKPSVDMLIEVGPHSALAEPIRQVMKRPQLKGLTIPYTSCLVTEEDAVQTRQAMACLLLSKGYPVNLRLINFPWSTDNLQVLHDLPSYPWNHKVHHWHESRLNRQHRLRRHRRHDLLDSQQWTRTL